MSFFYVNEFLIKQFARFAMQRNVNRACLLVRKEIHLTVQLVVK